LLYLYPSNRLEDLAVLLGQVMKTRPKQILSPSTILVPNPGMQHWLNMQLCDYMGISMNIDCPMPTRYIWDLCRHLLGDEKVPTSSPYKREVLIWKIYELCFTTQCKEADFYDEISVYWDQSTSETEQQQRVFTFARQLADLFEQYLVFRDDWLLQWQAGKTQKFDSPRYEKFEKWQMWFWNKLVEWLPEHPVDLQNRAIAKLSEKSHKLPSDIYIFAINSISPIYLSFFDSISKHTQVHLFQLNPCVNYWGDAQSDIAIAKLQRKQALSASLDENNLHPLLRNLGAQGRDLNNLLVNMKHHEIAAFNFEPEMTNKSNPHSSNLLDTLQHDILSGQPDKVTIHYDGSIGVHACHSEVRELQVLKEVLLEKFNNLPKLQPKDVLVMCPSIETYSPYIMSIFTQSDDPKLNIPVSISDRKPIESEPFIVAFMTLLGLPKTRFDASSIIDLVSLPAIANKYALSPQQIDMCAMWLKDAAIDWGIDSGHLERQLGTVVKDNMHTWSWGLSRLLVGMCNAIDETLVDGLAPVSYIEGQNTVTLGRFLQVIESLEHVIQCLGGAKNTDEWTSLLMLLVDEQLLADEADVFAKKIVKEAIFSLQNNALLANFNRQVELAIVHEALKNLLSIPEVRSQFHTGNVTFCSMLPMRSIPFKVIAILGLNQKEFPRQDNPVEIDLMQAHAQRRGDRSRRGDDRYLFLESLVSARQYLHLSYQHKHIKNNSVREPSLVLKMLIDYCHEYYSPEALPIIEHALHPFGPDNFHAQNGYAGSFDTGWFACLNALKRESENPDVNHSNESLLLESDNAHIESKRPTEAPQVINSRELISFLKGSLKYYANKVLNLYLDKPVARDYTPIYKIQGLTQYKLRAQIEKLVKQPTALNSNTSAKQSDWIVNNWESLRHAWQLSGELPFLIGIEDELNSIFLDVVALQESLPKSISKQAKGQLRFSNKVLDYNFTYDLLYGLSNIKLNVKEPSLSNLVELWVHYLVLQIHVQNDEQHELLRQELADELQLPEIPLLASQIHYIKTPAKTDDARKVNIRQLTLSSSANAYDALSNILDVFSNGNQSPLLLDLDLAKDIIKFDSSELACTSQSLKAQWLNCSRPSSNGLGFFPHTYFDYLLTEMPDFTQQNLEPYFTCFGDMQQNELTVKTMSISNSLLSESRQTTEVAEESKDMT